MKAIGILWNSMNEFSEDAILDIQEYAVVTDTITIDFNDKFPEFLSLIYPYSGTELWKLEYKVANMNNLFDSNKISILFLEIDDSNKVYIERKGIYICKNVEKLKTFIRGKYSQMVSHYAFDNIYHMTDDELEYSITVKIIIDYIFEHFSFENKSIDLDELLGYKKEFTNKTVLTGKRNKFTLCNNQLIYKQEKKGTFESYSEVFCYNLYKFLEILSPRCQLASYSGSRGIISKNCIDDNEILIDGTHLIDTYLNYHANGILEFKKEISHTIEEIIIYNNCEDIQNIIDNIKDYFQLDLLDIMHDLKKMYAVDLLLLQSDRNSNNWGILYNFRTHNIRFAPLYDNSHIFGLNNPEMINKLANSIGDDDVFSSLLYSNNITLFRINHTNDLFAPKKLIIEGLDDNEVMDYLQIFLNKIELIGLENLVDMIIENIPGNEYDLEQFKTVILKSLTINIKNIKNKLENKKKLIYS